MLFIFACFQYTNHLPSHIMHSQCNNSFHNQFMRFKHIHNNPITLVNIGYSIHNFWRIPFDESHPYYHSVMCLYIYNSISHHDGCRLVHPNTWYHYSVLPSCRMSFSESRHVVSIIRFSHHVGCRFVHPDTWYQLFGSPIMSDAV